MASFGFSLGDIIVVSKLASSVYKSFRGAPNDFKVLKVDGMKLQQGLESLIAKSNQRRHFAFIYVRTDMSPETITRFSIS